ncbi:MAG: DUF4252 domain-containing protein [Bacteroidales bacterium]|nr:DUF4252 domain-containing protein [Bacteroidales bacterium]MDD6773263.1 DUF4252 domain-containing protein [Bacteroidales bacterium]
MKRIIMAIAATLICAASFAQSGKSIYNKYSDKSNVTAVYISPAMFKMMGQLPEIDTPDGDFNIAPVVKEMSGMYMIESGNPSINNALKADVEKYISNGTFELLMEAKEDGELVRLYTMGDKDTVSSFVMTVFEKTECVFLCIEGKIPRKELEELIASNMD